jgi:predicted nucleic acid-binding protein
MTMTLRAGVHAGLHRKPIPDLIIATVAQAHDAVLVHHDRDFDDIATVVSGLRTRWIVPPGQSTG